MGKIIGIDLGTTNSVAAVYEGDAAEIILTQEGDRLLPSMVAFSPDGERLVGNPARSQLITNANTVYSVKRLMGKRYSEVHPFLNQFNYPVVRGEGDTPRIRINDILFSPEEISAMILEKLKQAAENHLQDSIDGVIITVPAYFNDSQRQATRDAGEIAGLNVLRIINEPTAASLAFSLDVSQKTIVLVYDFGGGTIDISVLEVEAEVIKVLATAGDVNLGGSDFDGRLCDCITGDIKEQYGLDITTDKLAMQRVREAAETAKKELSGMNEYEVSLPFIADINNEPLHYSRYFNRPEFEEMVRGRVEDTLGICRQALDAAGLGAPQVDEVILVGGTTRIPLIQKRVREFFNKEPNKKVNPDEIVSMGAARQGSVIKGDSRDIVLLDVIPISLGVKTHGGTFTRVIAANTTIPTNQSLVFSTVEDGQTEVEIVVYQGEREIVGENKLLGEFTLTGIESAPRGVSRIEVSFSINVNGILTVSATDLGSSNKKQINISNSGLLSKSQINEIKKSAWKHKNSDEKQKELITVRNRVEDLLYSLKEVLSGGGIAPDGKLAAEAGALVRKTVEELDGDDAAGLANVLQLLENMDGRMREAQAAEAGGELVLEPVMQVKEPPPDLPEPDIEDILSSVSQPRDPRAIELVAREALNMKKEILDHVYAIEQYLDTVRLDRDLQQKAKALVAQAHIEVENEESTDLDGLLRDIRAITGQLDRVAGIALGFE